MAVKSPRFPAFTLLAILLANSLSAATYVVSPSGKNTAAGTLVAPWKTLAHAAAKVRPGDTVEVRTGIYSERLLLTRSGTAQAPIVFRARAGETPVIDGTKLSTDSGWLPLIWLQGVSHVTVQGFELRNYYTAQKNRVPIGILVNGSGTGVHLLDNRIHHLGTTYTGATGGDAHGIAIYGDETSPIRDITIRGNRLHHLKLGSSEALVLNGNVAGFLVESNTIRACNNIGIDFIGHEDTCPDPAQDAARDGIVRLNTVYGINSYGNPAYGKNYSAGGIYVDGGRDILIEQNTVYDCDIGIELASEHAGESTSAITLRKNLIHHNRIGGLFMGGYDTKRGSTEDCLIEENTFVENDTLRYGNGEIQLQFDVRDTIIRQNLIVTNQQSLVIGNPYTKNTDNTVDYTTLYTPGKPRWQWKTKSYSGLSAWRTASKQDAYAQLLPSRPKNLPAAP